jgi:hypothetical protein
MDWDAAVTHTIEDDRVSIECERCDAEEFLGFRECRACARVLDPRRISATDTAKSSEIAN